MKVIKDIKTWYTSTFPTDELGDEINPQASFDGLKSNLPNVYDYIAVGDSLVRQRLFVELSKRLNVSYNQIYGEWLNG